MKKVLIVGTLIAGWRLSKKRTGLSAGLGIAAAPLTAPKPRFWPSVLDGLNGREGAA